MCLVSHHSFTIIFSFPIFLTVLNDVFAGGFGEKWVFFDGVFVVFSWSIRGDFVVPGDTLFDLEKYANFSKYFSL